MSDGVSLLGWIAVDLDGTLAEYHGWVNTFHIGAPIPLMVARVKEWLAAGCDVRIFTARVDGGLVGESMGVDAETVQRYKDTQAITAMIQDWTEEHLGTRLAVTCKKDYGMVQLWDDRCVQVIPNIGVAIQDELSAITVERDQLRTQHEQDVAAIRDFDAKLMQLVEEGVQQRTKELRERLEAVSIAHNCDLTLRQMYPDQAQASDGEKWTCICGKVWVHVCDEAEGCSWAEAQKGPQ